MAEGKIVLEITVLEILIILFIFLKDFIYLGPLDGLVS